MGRDTDDDLDPVQPEDKDPATFGQEVPARRLEKATATSDEKEEEANQQ